MVPFSPVRGGLAVAAIATVLVAVKAKVVVVTVAAAVAGSFFFFFFFFSLKTVHQYRRRDEAGWLIQRAARASMIQSRTPTLMESCQVFSTAVVHLTYTGMVRRTCLSEVPTCPPPHSHKPSTALFITLGRTINSPFPQTLARVVGSRLHSLPPSPRFNVDSMNANIRHRRSGFDTRIGRPPVQLHPAYCHGIPGEEVRADGRRR